MTQRIEPFSDTTQRNEPFLLISLKELNPFFSDSNTCFFFEMTLRIELFQMWLKKKLNFLLNVTRRIEPFLWCLLELNLFFSHKTPRIEPFFNTTQRFGILNLTQNYFFWKWPQRIEPFEIWHKELNFFRYDPKKLNFFVGLWLQEWSFFEKYDSKNWTLLQNITQRIETHFFWNMTQRIGPICSNMTQRIEPFFPYDSDNWALFLNWLTELFFIEIRILTHRIFFRKKKVFFFEYVSHHWTFFGYDWQNWTFFEYASKNGTPFFLKWLKELNTFFPLIWLKELNTFLIWLKKLNLFVNMTHKIELFFFVLSIT